MESKIDKLMKDLERQGKVRELTEDECNKVCKHINEDMEAFRIEFLKKQVQSIDDTHRIILNS